MTRNGRPHAFGRTIQVSDEWIHDVMQELETEDPELAQSALRGALHALRDRVSPEEAVQLGAQLPMLLRGLYYEGFTLRAPRHLARTVSEFLAVASEASGRPDLEPERAVRAVFRVLDRRISAGEIDDLIGGLPKQVAQLWE